MNSYALWPQWLTKQIRKWEVGTKDFQKKMSHSRPQAVVIIPSETLTPLTFSPPCLTFSPAPGAYPVSMETSPVTGANIATCARRMPATAPSRRDESTPRRWGLERARAQNMQNHTVKHWWAHVVKHALTCTRTQRNAHPEAQSNTGIHLRVLMHKLTLTHEYW